MTMTATTIVREEAVRTGANVSIQHLSKTFGSQRVLHDVGFDLRPGEVVALLGQNGSGKSTLIKLLTGFHVPDADTDASLVVDGESFDLPIHSAGSSFKIAAVHQDLALLPSATVAENLLIDRLGSRALLPFRWSELHQRAERILRRVGATDVSTRAMVGALRPVQQAMVAIARAIDEIGTSAGGLLILDEVTAFLSQDGIEELFDLIAEVSSRGISVLFVSHRMEEIWRVCQRAVVLRNGEVTADVALADTTEDELVTKIVGQQLDWLYPEKHDASGPVALRVRHEGTGMLRQFELEASAGEIIGLTGLRGMGHDRVVYALYGEDAAAAGTLELDGVTTDLGRIDPRLACSLGLRLLPSDRLTNGAVGWASVRENSTLPALRGFVRFGMLQRRQENAWAEDLVRDYDVKPADPHAIYSSLSGGNQQKVLVGKWLATKPRLLLLDEPTQGVDVGARRDIFSRIVDAATSGVTVLYSTTEIQDLAELCHRVLVFRDGCVVGEVAGSQVNEENISRLCWSRGAASERMPKAG
jgi:ribose transport system ATP-binding protein